MELQVFKKLTRYRHNAPSLFLLLLPYLFITYNDIKLSEDFSFSYLSLCIVVLVIADIVFRVLYSKLAVSTRAMLVFNLIYCTVLIFFYFYFFPFQLFFIRGRFLIIVYWLLAITLITFLKKSYQFVNRVLLFLMLILIINQLYKTWSPQKRAQRVFSKHKLSVSYHSNKPVVLIILDEYAAPSTLQKNGMSGCCPGLVNYLDSAGWAVNQNSYSLETSTIHSLSSVFNGNVSQDGSYEQKNVSNVVTDLRNASVIKSLYAQNVLFKNYSFFTVGKNTYYKFIYAFPSTPTELLLINSSYLHLKIGADNFDPKAFTFDNYSTANYNEDVYHQVIEVLNHPGLPKQFIYLHLLMPHEPVRFGKEIAYRQYTLDNYYKYWLFTNKKIIAAVKGATHLSDYRIIISGDHGYRGNKKVDPHRTISAFYGFNKADIDQIKSVQDIGALIQQSFQ